MFSNHLLFYFHWLLAPRKIGTSSPGCSAACWCSPSVTGNFRHTASRPSVFLLRRCWPGRKGVPQGRRPVSVNHVFYWNAGFLANTVFAWHTLLCDDCDARAPVGTGHVPLATAVLAKGSSEVRRIPFLLVYIPRPTLSA